MIMRPSFESVASKPDDQFPFILTHSDFSLLLTVGKIPFAANHLLKSFLTSKDYLCFYFRSRHRRQRFWSVLKIDSLQTLRRKLSQGLGTVYMCDKEFVDVRYHGNVEPGRINQADNSSPSVKHRSFSVYSSIVPSHRSVRKLSGIGGDLIIGYYYAYIIPFLHFWNSRAVISGYFIGL